MSVLDLPCSSCSRTLRNVYEIYGTNCGHLFHANCLSATQSRNPSRRCPRCRVYAPVWYKLYETPEEIANINHLEAKLKMLTESKDQLEKDLDAKCKKYIDLQTETEKEVTKLKDEVQCNGDREQKLHGAYMKRISHLKEEFTAQKLQSEKVAKDIAKAIQSDYEQRIASLKANLVELTKQKEQLETELHVKQTQLEKSVKEIDKIKTLAQARSEKASRLLRDFERRIEEYDSIRKDKQLIELQTDAGGEISQLKGDIQLKEHKEMQIVHNKGFGDLRHEVNNKSMQSKYNNDMENLKLELQADVDNSQQQQQQVVIEKRKETITSLQVQSAGHLNNSVVPSTKSSSSKIKEDINEIQVPNPDDFKTGCIGLKTVGNNANDTNDITQLKEQFKLLEQKLQFMGSELDKEIVKSTQLEVENFTLQSYVDCLNNDITLGSDKTKVQSTVNPTYTTQKSDEMSSFNSLNMRRKEHSNEPAHNSIIVRNYPKRNRRLPLVVPRAFFSIKQGCKPVRTEPNSYFC